MRDAGRWAVVCVFAAAASLAEEWPGYQGGHTHRNASAVDVAPAGLMLLWQRPLASPTRQAARNLVVARGLVLLAANDPAARGPPAPGQIELVALDAKTGAIAGRLKTDQVNGGHGNKRYPTGMLADGRDAPCCLTTVTWDAAAESVYLRGAGDNSCNTAVMPFANRESWKPDAAVDGMPLYPGLAKASRAKAEANKAKYFQPIDQYGANRQNISCFLELDPSFPFMVTVGGAHSQASRAGRLIRRGDGEAIDLDLERSPGWAPFDGPAGVALAKAHAFGMFTFWRGVLLAGGRIFAMGPGDDCDGDGVFGKAVGFGFGTEAEDQANWPKSVNMDSPDQGLFLGSWDVTVTDGAPALSPAWAYRLHSPHKPQGPAEAESYLETDGFYRPKAWCWDGEGGAWAAWKPTRAGGLQLLHAEQKQLGTWDTPLGSGAMGQDVWPRIAATGKPGAETLVLFAANAVSRPYIRRGPRFGVIRAWVEEPRPPAAPAGLTVFDVAGKAIRWNYAFAGEPWTPRPNDSVGWLERTHMAVAGRWSWVGWVDTAGEGDAQLRLVGFDLTAAKPEPKTRAFPLGFAGKEYPESSLIDLVPCDGRLYAVVLRARRIDESNATQAWGGGGPGDWDAQLVLALQEAMVP